MPLNNIQFFHYILMILEFSGQDGEHPSTVEGRLKELHLVGRAT